MDLPDDLELTATQARVLGALIEKSATTPETYPLTLKALTTACNQSSSRFPVVDYDSQLVETTALALKSKGLMRVVHPAHGERATRYRHIAGDALTLDDAQLAVLSVLLLRGAQTVSELRTRTDRQHPFVDTTEVERVLGSLEVHPRRLVSQVERQPGQKESRWIQMLEVDPEGRASMVPAGVSAGSRPSRVADERTERLEARVALLETQVSLLMGELGLESNDVPPAESGAPSQAE